MMIIGEKEMTDKSVTLRMRDEKEQKELTRAACLDLLTSLERQ